MTIKENKKKYKKEVITFSKKELEIGGEEVDEKIERLKELVGGRIEDIEMRKPYSYIYYKLKYLKNMREEGKEGKKNLLEGLKSLYDKISNTFS